MDLSSEDVRLLQNALNEVLHGPDSIEEWEFHSRLGATREETLELLARLASER